MSYELYIRLPDEARSLPPPPFLNFPAVYSAFLGWVTALARNAVLQKPILKAGVHRQLFYITVGYYIGHYLARRANYCSAKRDQEMFDYVRRHPEDFKEKERKRLAEVLEEFYPIR